MNERTTALLRAAAFLRVTPARLAALRSAAQEAGADSGLVRAFELHGVLPLAARNLRAAAAVLPDDVRQRLDERERALREEGRRDGLTVRRVLEAAERAGLSVVLLKGASLARDLYDDPLLRSQGDVDVLVADGDVRPLVAVATEAGLVEPEDALPIWWHRLTHFHLKLEPALAMLKEVEVHWRLHHPALGLCIQHDALRARTREITVDGLHARTLDPLDRFLHLVTHLTSHWVRLPAAPTVETLDAWLAADPPRVRLKWFVDLAAEAERLAVDTPAGALEERACEWGGEEPLAFVARTLARAFPLDPTAAEWLASACAGAATDPSRAARPAAAATRPLAGLDFRREALALWPRWFWPTRAYWAARAPHASGIALLARRVVHAVSVLGKSLASAFALPAALLARPLSRPGRKRRKQEALAPERVLDVVTAWRAGAAEDPPGRVPQAGSDAIDV